MTPPEPASTTNPSTGADGRTPRVVIVGAGFAGMTAARRLAGAPVELTIVDRRNHHLFQPLLYQVATAALSPADIAVPIRSMLRNHPNVRVLLDEVTGVDMATRQVRTRGGRSLDYDHLLLCTGSEYSFFGHDEWARVAPSLKSIEDATDIRRKILLAFERAEAVADEDTRRRLLTFAIVGGGPTGVEMAGAVAELARATVARDFRRIGPSSAKVILVEAAPRLLGGFPERLATYAQRELEGMGVEVRLGAPIEEIDEEGFVAGGARTDAKTVIWCAGVKATPVGRWIGAETEKNGTVRVGPDLSLPGHAGVYILGDAASAAGPDGGPLPGLAAVAAQQGDYVGRTLAARLAGNPAPAPFEYRDRGTMATIGRSAAVADFGRFKLTGYLAWLVWGLVHIYLLIGFRNRTAVFVNWIWSWFTYGRGARLITGRIFGPEPLDVANAAPEPVDEKKAEEVR